MYKVMLVDDERIILDGISRLVDWHAIGTELVATAQNGIDAYARIVSDPPHIIVSDIRMPGIDGLELVRRTHASHPGIRFVLLSGFGEFEYASTAMQFGVKHYLLKPTNEHKIAEAITEIVADLKQENHKEQFVSEMKQGLAKVMPHVKEQVLKEFVTNKTYGSREWDYYRDLFHFEIDRPVRLLLFQLESGQVEFEQLFALKNIAEDLLETTLLGTTIGDHVLLLIEDPADSANLHRRIGEIRCTFKDYYKLDTTTALSEPDRITHARSLYQETLLCLEHRFYLGEGSLITLKDTNHAAIGADVAFSFAEERLTLPVRAGHRDVAEEALNDFIEALKQAALTIEQTKSYVIQQYVSLVRLTDPERMNGYYARIPAIVELSTLQAIHAFLAETVREMTARHYEQNIVKHTAIVRKVVAIIEAHLGDSQLSLQTVASEMLYMNADYLGKLFKKETGEKFSNYVMKSRIKQATDWMAADPDIKVFELAERLGFGDNPQYFSQVFKKHAGCTPSEYLRSI